MNDKQVFFDQAFDHLKASAVNQLLTLKNLSSVIAQIEWFLANSLLLLLLLTRVLATNSIFLCSMFSLLFLHLFLYGCNIFMWRKTRINYSFIFEFAPTKELKYRDVFLMCTTSMTVVVGVMFVHLSLVAKGHSSTQVHAIPGLLLLVIFYPASVFLLLSLHNANSCV